MEGPSILFNFGNPNAPSEENSVRNFSGSWMCPDFTWFHCILALQPLIFSPPLVPSPGAPGALPELHPWSQISPRLTYVQLLRAEPTKKISSLGQRTQSWSFGQEIGPIFGIFIQHHQCLTMIQVIEVAGPLRFLRLRPATPMAKWCKMDGGFSGRSGLDQITLQTQNESGAFTWKAQLGIAYDPHFPLLSEYRKIQPTSGRAALLSSHWSQSWAEQASWDPRAPTWSATSVINGQQWSNVSGPTQPHRPALPMHWTISLLCHLNFWYLLMGPLCQESDSWPNCWLVRPRKHTETHWLIHHIPTSSTWCIVMSWASHFGVTGDKSWARATWATLVAQAAGESSPKSSGFPQCLEMQRTSIPMRFEK